MRILLLDFYHLGNKVIPYTKYEPKGQIFYYECLPHNKNKVSLIFVIFQCGYFHYKL